MIPINDLLKIAVTQQASDLHLAAELTPCLRIAGKLQAINIKPFSAEQLTALLHPLLNSSQQTTLAQKSEIDFAGMTADGHRFRANIYHQQHGIAAAFRLIPATLPTMEQLQLPPLLHKFCNYEQGLVLITGATGSGKSSTLAAMINHINQTQARHIITIEDPIEFIYHNQQCCINQRELLTHTQSFQHALRAALRQDPDIILVGELRDLETIRLALTAAETGHLVFATLHTASAARTLDRVVDVFPGNEKDTIRAMLAESLSAVVSQKLLPKISGGRIAAFETLVCTPAIRHLIRDNKTAQIYSAIQTGQTAGMCTMQQYINQLQVAGKINRNYSPKYAFG